MPKARPVAAILTSPSRRYYRWAEIVRLAQRNEGHWLMVLDNVPAATVRAVRERRHVDLRSTKGGRLMAQARNVYTGEDGRQYADLFVKWSPEEER